jgi:hypothetical protein
MLVFITPKLVEERLPYSYRSRATIPSRHIKDSRVTDDIKSLKPGDIAVLGKKHSKEDAEYLISKEIKYIVDVADDKFEAPTFKHWYFTIPNANAITTTCHNLRKLIIKETGGYGKSYVIPDPTERPRGKPKFIPKGIMNAFYYGSHGNYSKLMWPEIKEVLNGITKTNIKIMTNVPEHEPTKWKYTKGRGGPFWLTPEQKSEIESAGVKQFNELIPWDFDEQGKLVEECDFVVLPVADDRHSTCKGNNRPIDALQQGRMVLTNPGIPSYNDLYDFLYVGDFYKMYQEMIDSPGKVISKITEAQKFIDKHYSPEAIAKKWIKVYEKLS